VLRRKTNTTSLGATTTILHSSGEGLDSKAGVSY
jgi:hypothetical protein